MVQETEFLPSLTAGLRRCSSQGEKIGTRDFADCCEALVPIIDRMGSVFKFVKGELEGKGQSLRQVQETHSTLDLVIYSDKEAGVVTSKGSRSRNLHRLMTVMAFVRVLLEYLKENKQATLREAAAVAYDKTLGPYHATVLKIGVKASFITLPTRQYFIDSIGETEESAAARAAEFIQAADNVCTVIEKLYAGCKMPVSDVKFLRSG